MRNCFELKSALVAGLAATLVVVAAAAAAQEKRFDGVTLRVSTYGGSWRDNVHALVGADLERRGAKVEYVIGSTRDNLAKMIAARGQIPPFDVMEIEEATRPSVQEGDFLLRLDYGRIPNAQALDAIQRRDDMVGIWVTQHALVYNKQKFQEMGIAKPERFIDLMNPKLKGRVSFPDINFGFVVTGLVGFAAEAGGDETNIDPGFEMVKKLEVTSYFKSSPALESQFKAGDVWAAWWQAGWAMRLHKAGLPVGLANPRVKDKVGMAQVGWIAILKGTQVREAAEAFVDRYLDPQVQEELTRRTGVIAAHPEAERRLTADPVLNEFLILKPEEVRNIYFVDMAKVKMDQWIDKWNRVLAR